ncbi:hypothetical protein FisN_18Hu165 [Fistulifera solaris]|uniref:Uncharacterized protein n=1 Tax=Fistulifera solaris TaxID=1519565 RepID=A0A1Z5JV86_FISSO|nr:hypothetical protein FisN_18Hu165 [Fistulifera solaris]|eukprot:GAX17954.1 hypothetical protein FisN_18Hu165 [Fistulifera solaris]
MDHGNDILELIPKKQLTETQRSLQRRVRPQNGGLALFYRFLREPNSLEEINWDQVQDGAALWRDNGTVVTNWAPKISKHLRYVLFDIDFDLTFIIVGQTDDAVAETFTFLWSLDYKGCDDSNIYSIWDHRFDFDALSADQLARILDANRGRTYNLQYGTWNKEQSEILASRSYYLKLQISYEFIFADGGTAFIDALERRSTSFGYLEIACTGKSKIMSNFNWARLFKLDRCFEELRVAYLGKRSLLLPFSMKVKSLVYAIKDEHLEPKSFESLDIATKDLTLKMWMEGLSEEPAPELPISLLKRAAELGHFERFQFSLRFDYDVATVEVEEITDAIIHFIKSNPKLTTLVLGNDDEGSLYWCCHLQYIFYVIEDHPSLRSIKVDSRRWNDSTFSWLERLLTRNRNVTVSDYYDKIISNGSNIDHFYAVNRLAVPEVTRSFFPANEMGQKDNILDLIPNIQLSAGQRSLQQAMVSFCDEDAYVYMYRLRREPSYLEDIKWKSFRDGVAILRDNDTVIAPRVAYQLDNERFVSFGMNIGEGSSSFTIFGKTDRAVAETATFFWSLKNADSSVGWLCVEAQNDDFDFAALQAGQLARILDANPERTFDIQTGNWTTEQSEVLASRSFPLKVKISGTFAFQDEGTAFVDELQRRQTPFGRLDIECDDETKPFSFANWERFLKLDVTFEELRIGYLEEGLTYLPFYMKTESLEYAIKDDHLELEKIASLDIVTRDLALKMKLDDTEEDWTQLPISFLNRVAELGHFEKFQFSVVLDYEVETDEIESIADAFMNAVNRNRNLATLTLGDAEDDSFWDWGHNLQRIFKEIEKHPSLRTFRVKCIDWDDSTFQRLKDLLSQNRQITVTDIFDDKIISGDIAIDKLYALNRFFNGSKQLFKEKPIEQSLLVTAALTQSALTDFQYISLLMSDHTDVLSDFIIGVCQDEAATGLSLENEHTASSIASYQATRRPKRKRRFSRRQA